MAPRIIFIKDIKAGKIDWRIKVRVLHMWKIPEYNNPNVTKSMEIVLLDEKSEKIQASIKQNLLDMFENTLEEGSCYLIQNMVSAEVGDNIKVPLPVNNEEILQITDVSPAVNDLKVDSIANTPCADKNKGKRIFEEVDFGSPIDGCGTQNSSTKMPKLNENKKEPSE